MENNNNNNKMFRSTTQNVSSVASSLVTPLNTRKMNRLTAVKRLARNRQKTYPKYGPYPCKWCEKKFLTSQYFAAHMRSHYCKDEKIALKAGKGREQKRANLALKRAKAELKKAQKRTEELTLLLAEANAKAQAAAQAMTMAMATATATPSSTQPNSCVLAVAAQAPAPAPKPARAAKDTNTKLVVVKHQVFPDEGVNPPPGFQHLLTTGPDGRQFIIQKAKLEYYDDDVVACGSLNDFDLNL